MKIIQTTPYFHPVIGGKETAILNISLELIKRGHEVTVFTSDSLRRGRIHNKEEVYKGVEIKRFKSWFRVGPVAVFFPGIVKDLLTMDYDVILAHTYRQPQSDLSLICAKVRRKKCILITHKPFMSRDGLNKIVVSLYDLILSYIFLRFYDKVICLFGHQIPFFKSRKVKEENIAVIPNGVENIFSRKCKKNIKNKFNLEGKIVLNVATLTKQKGQDLLLQAISLMKNKATLVFVGHDAGFKSKLEEKVKELDLNNVIFLGGIDQNDLACLYQQSDVFVFPSRYEPFGIVALEAMASGLPVVATKFGGTKEFVHEPFGKIVDPYDPQELANAIDYFLSRKYTGKEGIEEAKKFSWEEQVEKLEKILVELVACG